ncbi:hypothetical protein [Roseovarius salinarum]|uniref:hypothetical protein n=1 Tax=Roseovarius salinarum TaxID=1981892 RepID=UPI000C32C376|nr:hypothetical protein [Roseovarius salinarum]
MPRFTLSPADTFLFGLANATLLFTLGYWLTGMGEAYRGGFGTEDGPIEWGTAILLFIAALVLLRNAVRLGARGHGFGAALTWLYALAFVFGSGEEISWGQRVFGWESGEFFREHNAQTETNFHNLVVGDTHLVNTVFGPALTLVILLYLVVLPLACARLGWLRRLADRLAIPLPAQRHVILTLIATLVIGVIPMGAKWESYEFVFGVLVVSIFLAPRNSEATT